MINYELLQTAHQLHRRLLVLDRRRLDTGRSGIGELSSEQRTPVCYFVQVVLQLTWMAFRLNVGPHLPFGQKPIISDENISS